MIEHGPKEAYQLLHAGALALAEMEAAGIAVDTEYLDRAITDTRAQSVQLETELRKDPIYGLWRRQFGMDANLGSPDQLGHIFFDVLKHPCHAKTPTGKYATNKENFAHIDSDFVRKYFRKKELDKAKSTYLDNLKRETCDGFFHPVFNLHTASTFRSSSGADKEDDRGGRDLNFQNLPIRNPLIGKTIRECFISRDGRVLIEADYGSLEFKIAAVFWRDPGMVAYASDPDKDIHKDTAAKLFKCPRNQVSKQMRQTAKTYFVFPILYGSYYLQCAKNIWIDIAKQNLKLVDGTPVFEWLTSKGINELGACNTKERPVSGTFEHHVKKVEDGFYNEFPTFAEKKESWWKAYQETGGFRMMTGFQVNGIYTRNYLMNSPIQGPAFHFLLWSIIQIQKEIKKLKLKSLLVGTIHDCLLIDSLLSELQQILNIVERVMTVDVRKEYPCIIVPLLVEVDITPVGKSWFWKEPYTKMNGIWIPKNKAA